MTEYDDDIELTLKEKLSEFTEEEREHLFQEHPDWDGEDHSVSIGGYEIIDMFNEYDAEALFMYAAKTKCSDIHLLPGNRPRLRINGILEDIRGLRPLTDKDLRSIQEETMSDADLGIFSEKFFEHVYAYNIPTIARYRMIITRSMDAFSIVGRKLIDKAPTFEELDTNPTIRDLANLPSGIVLVSGVTGSGKSTLMAAMIDQINTYKGVNIISIEDPVEILHHSKKANIIQRNIGTDVKTFAAGIRDAMRQDPDVILIGEIRDNETAEAALNAAETGHLVISTVHAKTAVTAISRMLDLFSGDKATAARNKFADVLRAIVCQKLVLTADAKGRVPVNEILLNIEEIQHAIEQEKPATEIRKYVDQGIDGMQTFEKDFLRLVISGTITEKVAQAQAEDQKKMKELLDKYHNGQIQITTTEKGKTQLLPPTPTPTKHHEEQPKRSLSFSERLRKEREEKGIVENKSGASPQLNQLPPKIQRPQIYIP